MATPSRKALRNALVQMVCDLAEERDWTDELHRRLVGRDDPTEPERTELRGILGDVQGVLAGAGLGRVGVVEGVKRLAARVENEKCRTRRQGDEISRLRQLQAENAERIRVAEESEFVAAGAERDRVQGLLDSMTNERDTLARMVASVREAIDEANMPVHGGDLAQAVRRIQKHRRATLAEHMRCAREAGAGEHSEDLFDAIVRLKAGQAEEVSDA